MKAIKMILPVLLVIVFSCCSTNKAMINTSVVKKLDLNKYLGTWYELARFPHSFEKGLVGVTATYSLRDDGMIKVVNQGYKNTLSGKHSIAVGKAKIPNPLEPAKLKVSFFWIFYGDYYVMELDDNYQWAIIGSSSDNYLWILSRKPIVEDNLYNMLVEKARNRGYNTKKLIKVEQKAD